MAPAESNEMIHIIFDLDATLYPHTTGYEAFIIQKIYDFMVDKLGVPREKVVEEQQRIFSLFGQTLRGIRAPRELGGLGRTDFDLQSYWDEIRGTERDQARYLSLDPGVESLIRGLKATGKARLWVFTNADEKNGQIALECILGREAASMFEGVFGAFFLGESLAKPSKEAFLKVFEKMGLPTGDDAASVEARRNVIMFEDSASNLKTAKELGIGTVWVTGGRHRHLSARWHGQGASDHVAVPELTAEKESKLKAKYPFADHIVDRCDFETVQSILPDLFA